MNKPDSPCHNCDRRVLGCHVNCRDYIIYCEENARIKELLHADQEKDAQIRGYEHEKKQKKKVKR